MAKQYNQRPTETCEHGTSLDRYCEDCTLDNLSAGFPEPAAEAEEEAIAQAQPAVIHTGAPPIKATDNLFDMAVSMALNAGLDPRDAEHVLKPVLCSIGGWIVHLKNQSAGFMRYKDDNYRLLSHMFMLGITGRGKGNILRFSKSLFSKAGFEISQVGRVSTAGLFGSGNPGPKGTEPVKGILEKNKDGIILIPEAGSLFGSQRSADSSDMAEWLSSGHISIDVIRAGGHREYQNDALVLACMQPNEWSGMLMSVKGIERRATFSAFRFLTDAEELDMVSEVNADKKVDLAELDRFRSTFQLLRTLVAPESIDVKEVHRWLTLCMNGTRDTSPGKYQSVDLQRYVALSIGYNLMKGVFETTGKWIVPPIELGSELHDILKREASVRYSFRMTQQHALVETVWPIIYSSGLFGSRLVSRFVPRHIVERWLATKLGRTSDDAAKMIGISGDHLFKGLIAQGFMLENPEGHVGLMWTKVP